MGTTGKWAGSRRAWTAVVLAFALFAAACGGDDDTDTGAADTGATAAEAADDATVDGEAAADDEAAAEASEEDAGAEAGVAANADGVTDYLAYVGGTAGPADESLEPVVIGWLNQEGGAFEISAAATIGADLAVQLVNEQLGGIDGRPVVLQKCFIESAEEEGTTCGQELGNNDDVVAIVTGGVAIGVQPFYATIAGEKPVYVGVGVTPIDQVQDNATLIFGSATSVLGPYATYARDVAGAETAALLYPDNPTLRAGATVFQTQFAAAGVDLSVVAYDPSATDLIGPLTAGGVQDVDLVIAYTDLPGCVNLANALIQLGIDDPTRIIAAPFCLNPQVAEGLGGGFPNWTYGIASSLFGDPTDPSGVRFQELTDEYEIAAAPDPWVRVTFSTMLTAIKHLNEVGVDAGTEAIVAHARAFEGPVPLGAPNLNCGADPEQPAVCNNQTQFFTYLGEAGWDKQAGYLPPPS